MKKKSVLLLRDRVDFYKDFAFNLLYTIDKYYLDRETLSNDTDIRNHYDWCFNRVCDGFELEEIYFKDNDELREYYYDYYYPEYYTKDYTIELKEYIKFFEKIFNVENQKNKQFTEVLLDIYEISENSINNKTVVEKMLAV